MCKVYCLCFVVFITGQYANCIKEQPRLKEQSDLSVVSPLMILISVQVFNIYRKESLNDFASIFLLSIYWWDYSEHEDQHIALTIINRFDWIGWEGKVKKNFISFVPHVLLGGISLSSGFALLSEKINKLNSASSGSWTDH